MPVHLNKQEKHNWYNYNVSEPWHVIYIWNQVDDLITNLILINVDYARG